MKIDMLENFWWKLKYNMLQLGYNLVTLYIIDLFKLKKMFFRHQNDWMNTCRNSMKWISFSYFDWMFSFLYKQNISFVDEKKEKKKSEKKGVRNEGFVDIYIPKIQTVYNMEKEMNTLQRNHYQGNFWQESDNHWTETSIFEFFWYIALVSCLYILVIIYFYKAI